MTVNNSSKHTIPPENNDTGKVTIEQLYTACYKRLLYRLIGLTNDRTLSEDILGDLFAKLLKQQRTFDSVAKGYSFLFVCAEREIIRHSMRSKTHNRIHHKLKQTTETTVDITNTLDDKAILLEAERAIEQLPERQKMVLRLVSSQHSTEEIAQAMNISPQTVLNTKTKAKNKVVAALLKKGFQPDQLKLKKE